MPASILRVLFLAALSLVLCLYAALHLGSRVSVEYPSHVSSNTSSDLGCDIDQDTDCLKDLATSKHEQSPASKTEPPNHVPGRLDYPQGYTRFAITSPNSPYHDGTSKDEGDANTSTPDGKPKSDGTLLEQLEKWVPYDRKYNKDTTNPVIWQTYREEPASNSIPYLSWTEKNKPAWSRTFISEENREQYVQSLTREMPILNETYHALPSKIMQLDFLRYVTLFKNGGVYADVDTHCVEPIEAWYNACYSESLRDGARPARSIQPGLLVGIDFDVTSDPRFDDIHGRQVGIANHVFAANKGHPALARVIAQIVATVSDEADRIGQARQDSAPDEGGEEARVSGATGVRQWTDQIERHIQSHVHHFDSTEWHGLRKAKVVDDVCILPISAFGSGQLRFSASPDSSTRREDLEVPVMVKHFRMHLW